jgi:DNA polymerase III epsilon subunit-like protein
MKALTKPPGQGLKSLKKFCQLNDKPLTIFDLETTRMSPHFPGFRIIEIGLLTISPHGSVDTEAELINPDGRRLSKEVRKLTGIQPKDLKGQPKTSA